MLVADSLFSGCNFASPCSLGVVVVAPSIALSGFIDIPIVPVSYNVKELRSKSGFPQMYLSECANYWRHAIEL